MTSNRTLFTLLALIGLTFAVFALWPELDLWVTGRFYQAGFAWETAAPISQALRAILWDISILMPLVALVLTGGRICVAPCAGSCADLGLCAGPVPDRAGV